MKILQIDGNGRIVGEYSNPSEAAKRTGFDSSHIIKVLKGKRSTHGGYKWRYEDGEVDQEDSDTEFLESRTREYKGNKAVLTAKTERSIQSLEEAIEFFEIDTDKWDVDRFVVNSWDVSMKSKDGSSFKRTNYQVKVWLVPRERTVDEVVQSLNKVLSDYTPKPIPHTSGGNGVITVELADFHIGADIRNLTRTPDFNIGIIGDYIHSITKIVNEYKADAVVYNMHGDFVESITGLNHEDSWKSVGMDMYGANVLILANELIAGILISGTNNVKQVNLVSGNHDRISKSKSVDNYGEGAKILAWSLQKDFPDLEVNFNPLILVNEIDDIVHIMTHGHHGISKRDSAKVIADYGDTSKFNLWTEGHMHSRSYKRVLKSKLTQYDTIEYVELDEQKYRKLVLPPLFTGNFFSESIGYSGWAGFVITFNNGRGIPNAHDYTL